MRRYGVRFEPPDPALTADRLLSGVDGPLGLYVHVPFCGVLCPFCPYNKVRYERDLAIGYLGWLRREAAAYRLLSGRGVTSLYVGGGTPTLCLDGLSWLPDVEVAGERAIEVLPTHMTPRTADRLVDMRFDAVSIGAQSFHESVLRHLRRPTTVADNRRAVALARERFRVVDVDLIFDVAYDEPCLLLDDLAEAFSHCVDQVSTYPLMRFGYTPFGKAEHDRRAEHRLLSRATALAADHGYRRESVWTFRRDGGDAYTSITRPYYLGVGAGAATFTGRSFSVNHFGLQQYGAATDDGRLPVALVATLPRSLAAAYRVFWQSYTGSVPTASPDPLLSHPVARGAVALARSAGWMTDVDGDDRLTARGYDRYHDLERWVTYHLIEPLWADLMREHAAPRSAVGTGAPLGDRAA